MAHTFTYLHVCWCYVGGTFLHISPCLLMLCWWYISSHISMSVDVMLVVLIFTYLHVCWCYVGNTFLHISPWCWWYISSHISMSVDVMLVVHFFTYLHVCCCYVGGTYLHIPLFRLRSMILKSKLCLAPMSVNYVDWWKEISTWSQVSKTFFFSLLMFMILQVQDITILASRNLRISPLNHKCKLHNISLLTLSLLGVTVEPQSSDLSLDRAN